MFVFSLGTRTALGGYQNPDPDSLTPPMKRLKVIPLVVIPRTRGTRPAQPPTWEQLKHLTPEGENMVQRQGLPITSKRLFLAMLAIVTIQAKCSSDRDSKFLDLFS